MAKPWKTRLFATAEDDIRQFGAALFGLFRAAPRAMAKRAGTTTRRDFAPRIDLWDSSRENRGHSASAHGVCLTAPSLLS